MRNGQRDFFSENWVMLVGDNAEQALDWLQIRKYYSDIIELDDLDEVFTLSLIHIYPFRVNHVFMPVWQLKNKICNVSNRTYCFSLIGEFWLQLI